MGRGLQTSRNHLALELPAPLSRQASVAPKPSTPAQYRIGHNGGPALDRQCSDCGARITVYSRGRCKKCGDTARMRPVPIDFLDRLEVLGSNGCAKHYAASLTTVTKWRKLKGIRPQHRARKPSKTAGLFRTRGPRPLMIHRDHTPPGQAADFLKKYGSVYRCNERRLADPKGKFWNRNGWLLTDEDVMQRAGRLGWVAMAL